MAAAECAFFVQVATETPSSPWRTIRVSAPTVHERHLIHIANADARVYLGRAAASYFWHVHGGGSGAASSTGEHWTITGGCSGAASSTGEHWTITGGCETNAQLARVLLHEKLAYANQTGVMDKDGVDALLTSFDRATPSRDDAATRMIRLAATAIARNALTSREGDDAAAQRTLAEALTSAYGSMTGDKQRELMDVLERAILLAM